MWITEDIVGRECRVNCVSGGDKKYRTLDYEDIVNILHKPRKKKYYEYSYATQ